MRTYKVQEPFNFCGACTLSRSQFKKTHYVPTELNYVYANSDGVPKIDMLVVGDWPDHMDDVRGIPFSDHSGLYIRDLVEKNGLGDRVAYATVMRCRPIDETDSKKTRLPTYEDKSACINYIQRDIEWLKPKVVLLVGSLALEKVPNNPNWAGKSISAVKGDMWVDPSTGIMYMPVVNPQVFMSREKLGNTARQRNSGGGVQNYSEEKRFKNHIKLAVSFCDGNVDEFSSLGCTYYLTKLSDVFEIVNIINSMDPAIDPDQWAVGLDYETQNTNRVAPNGISCIQLAPDNFNGFIIPLEHHDSPWAPDDLSKVKDLLKWMFENPHSKFECWVAHNDQFDLDKTLRYFDIKRLPKPTINPIFLEFLIDENQRAQDGEGGYEGGFALFNLKTMARERLGFNHYDLDILENRSGGNFWTLPLHGDSATARKFRDYCAMDAYVGRRLACAQRKEMTPREFDFAKKWGSRVSHFFVKLERTGIYADENQLDYLRSDYSPIVSRLSEIPEEIYSSEEGKKANLQIIKDSPQTSGQRPLFGFHKLPRVLDIGKKQHLKTLFVDVCNLEPLAYTSDGITPRIDKDFLKEHSGHPIVDKYKEHSELFKLKTSYLNSVKDFLTKDVIFVRKRKQNNFDNLFDGKIHANFGYDKTVSGRLASWGPNIQQLPRGENFYRMMIKSLYGSPPGFLFIESDYGQAEVRWWANISNDQKFIKLLANMKEIEDEYIRNPTPENAKRVKAMCDIHRQVASTMYQKDIFEVTKFERQGAKGLTFGAIFGQSTHALAQILGVTEDVAEELQRKFLSQFECAGNWLFEIEAFAERHGYVENPYGRRRHLKHLFALNPGAAKRMARNSPIQSASSDTTALAACLLQNRKEDLNLPFDIINIVHDAISVQAPIDVSAVEETIYHMRDCMTNISGFLYDEFGVELNTVLVNDYKIGLRWGHAASWDEGEPVRIMVEQCREWDDMLKKGIQWWQIATTDEIQNIKTKYIPNIENDPDMDDSKKNVIIGKFKKDIEFLETSLREYHVAA